MWQRVDMIGHSFRIVILCLCACARAAVINGKAADIHEFPHAVAYGACVATLISDRWVLSAAHCYKPWHKSVEILSLPLFEQRKFIKRSIIHPRYRLGENYVNNTKTEIYATYDYLLLELRERVRSVKYLKLDDGPEPPAGTKSTFPSLDTFQHDDPLSDLYKGELYTVSDAECARRLQNFDTATMLCAVGGPPSHAGVCYGDSGSGLMVNGRLLGVLSWVEGDAIDCGADRMVVAARLSTPEIRQWIRSFTGTVPVPAEEVFIFVT